MSLRSYIIVVLAALPSLLWAKEVPSISAISIDQIGEFVTLKGSAAGHSPPGDNRNPHSFRVKDLQGDVIRVVSWPDIFTNVENRHLLDDPATSVTITGEVKENKGRLELQLHDWEEIELSAMGVGAARPGNNSGVTTGAVEDGAVRAAGETSISDGETTGPGQN